LIAVLKEVKYLGMLQNYKIPAEATAIHDKNDQYRKFITSLDYTVDSYNKILSQASKEEKPLIASELKKLDSELENGEKNLKWKSPNIEDYIVNIRSKVSDVEIRLQKSKSNLEKIQTLMSARADTPLFRRYEQKSTLLQLDDKQQRLDNRSKEIRETGQKIHDLVKENMSLLNVDDLTSQMWKDYCVYADNMVLEGFNKIVACSLSFFLRETDFDRSDLDPLFEAQLQLKPPELVFSPSLNYGEPNGFFEQVEINVGHVYAQGSLIPRVAGHLEQKDYQSNLETRIELTDMRNEFMERVMNILTKANEFKYSFNKYSYLWVDDRQEFMKQFLLYNHVPSQEEIDAYAESGVPECPPTLEQFKGQVDTYENIYNDINKLDDFFIIDKWFRVDNRPFKTVLLNIVKKWSYMFKQHLMDDITNSLQELEDFMLDKNRFLIRDVPEGNYVALVEMMGHLAAVREKAVIYDDMFDPIKQKIELLKTYGQEVSDEIYDNLQVTFLCIKRVV